MKVYLIPAASGRYELYCEVSSAESATESPATSRLGQLFGYFRRSFRRMLEEGEAERHGRTEDAPQRGAIWRFVSRKVAEAVA